MLRSIVLCLLIAGCLGGSPQRINPPKLPDSRIVGGTEAEISQHPYQLSLQTTGHICGASIISSKWVATAAHCVDSSPKRYSLRAGNNDKYLGTRYAVKRIVRHPNYNANTIDYDIALLEIDGVFQFNSNVKPVQLATAEPSPNSIVNITGWGAVRQGGSVSPYLMRVSVPVVGRTKCQEAYKSMNTITTRMICAGYTEGGKDSCQGDSGGPLTAHGTLYGIVSWGYGCAQPKYPGVYTNVAQLRSWVKQISGV